MCLPATGPGGEMNDVRWSRFVNGDHPNSTAGEVTELRGVARDGSQQVVGLGSGNLAPVSAMWLALHTSPALVL